MAETAYERLVATLEAHGSIIRSRGHGRVSAQCPSHDDRAPSLSITAIDGQALVFCHAGCGTADILDKLGWSMADLYDDHKGATYRYDSGRVVHRWYDSGGRKRFRQSGTDAKVELYRLDRLRGAGEGAVFLVEGEKDVHAIEAAGGIATTAPMGAQNINKCDLTPLYGRDVVAIADNDLPGLTWAQQIRDLLHGRASSLRFGHAKEGKDAADHVAAGHSLRDWLPLELAQPETQPDRELADLMREIYQQRLRREARRRLDAEERPPAALPEILTLRERLARPRTPVAYRIDGWQPAGSRVMLAAQFKAGKTTLVGNLIRALVDGDAFLDRHATTPIEGNLTVLDFEMSSHQLDSWLEDQRIRNDDRVVVLPMRGNAGAFDILDASRRARWSALLRSRSVSYLIVDCLRPILDALGLDEHRDAGRFLVALDALLKEAEIDEATVVHHMGHQAERSRGDSRIRDWPDVEWRLVRQDDEPASPRYISAYGRDVDQAEAAVEFDAQTRHLALVGGSRKEAASRAALAIICGLFDLNPEPMSGNQIEQRTIQHGCTQKGIREALRLGVQDGVLVVMPGKRNAKMYGPAKSSSSVRQTSSSPRQRSEFEFVSSFIDDELNSNTREAPSSSGDEVP